MNKSKSLVAASILIALALTGCCNKPQKAKLTVTPLPPSTVNGDLNVNGNLNVNGTSNFNGPANFNGPVTGLSSGAPVTALARPMMAARPVTAATAPASGDVQELELKKEQLSVAKTVVPAGSVVIKKVVTSTSASAPVTLSHDEYTVERVSSSQAPATPFEEKQISIPLSQEQATAVVTPVVKEIYRLHKTSVAVSTNVTATVREENIVGAPVVAQPTQ